MSFCYGLIQPEHEKIVGCWMLDRCAAGSWKLERLWLPDRWRGEIRCSLLLSDYFLAPYYVQHIPAWQPAFPNAATLRAPCAEASLLRGIRCSKETLKNKQELHFLLVESRKGCTKGQSTMYKGTKYKVQGTKYKSPGKALKKKAVYEKSPAEPDSFVCVS